MKSITLCMFLLVQTLIGNSQENYQYFKAAGFKVKCACQLKVNNTFIQMAKEQGQNNILAAYVCAENSDDPETGVIINININDLSSSYIGISPSMYAYFEKSYLDQYAKQLAANGMTYSYGTFKGLTSLEYKFDQMGLPTKAMIFVKDKKSYLIQAGTRQNLNSKYNSLKLSFDFY
ncbi:MAG: hypothetical protein IPP81_19090 [Chitinophagaceae bacterium]|nr:hypothetical protein [Chitinophagaceae bacterium]